MSLSDAFYLQRGVKENDAPGGQLLDVHWNKIRIWKVKSINRSISRGCEHPLEEREGNSERFLVLTMLTFRLVVFWLASVGPTEVVFPGSPPPAPACNAITTERRWRMASAPAPACGHQQLPWKPQSGSLDVSNSLQSKPTKTSPTSLQTIPPTPHPPPPPPAPSRVFLVPRPSVPCTLHEFPIPLRLPRPLRAEQDNLQDGELWTDFLVEEPGTGGRRGGASPVVGGAAV